MTEPHPYEVYAVRYATAMRKRPEVFIGGDPHDGPLPMDYFVWAARNESHTVVIDTGFDANAAQRRGRQFLRDPGEGLRQLGIDCAQVQHVIVTHLHYDHAGNLRLFPRARFHLQEREMAFATGKCMGHPFFAHAYDLEAVLSMVRLVYDARVQFHDGDAEIVPGISVHGVGGHTHGLQFVRVWTRVGWVVLASDAAHYLDNMTCERPFPIVADVMQMFSGWERLRALASRPNLIVPGHDPAVMQLYREPAAELRGVAVRLDAEPEPRD
ncbi:MAG TPA: N-acyl homoserine lactonase family protein [Steroidobacteraceae bacterium]|nr:N-acyl homoserine lactonase family protein [Steroidobacteraceae bacterium]